MSNQNYQWSHRLVSHISLANNKICVHDVRTYIRDIRDEKEIYTLICMCEGWTDEQKYHNYYILFYSARFRD